ncbi:hypothetical protein HDU96_008980 [Phlyctochytrium bullatum]|nr:hypothetical protein HDU96_008980 [Phlyctochytrium bullatum]
MLPIKTPISISADALHALPSPAPSPAESPQQQTPRRPASAASIRPNDANAATPRRPASAAGVRLGTPQASPSKGRRGKQVKKGKDGTDDNLRQANEGGAGGNQGSPSGCKPGRMDRRGPAKGNVQVVQAGAEAATPLRQSDGASRRTANAISITMTPTDTSHATSGPTLVPFSPRTPSAGNTKSPGWKNRIDSSKKAKQAQSPSCYMTYDPLRKPDAQLVKANPALPSLNVHPNAQPSQHPNCLASRLLRPGSHFLNCVYLGPHDDEDTLKIYHEFLHAGKDRWKVVAVTRGQLKESRGCVMAPRKLHKALLGATGLSEIKRVDKFAKYAGLVFGDLAAPLVRLESVEIAVEADVKRGDYCFTDGCGGIGWEAARELWARTCAEVRNSKSPSGTPYGAISFAPLMGSPDERHRVPSVMQIRALGVKGVVVVDPRLPGRAVSLVESMRKLKVLDIMEVLEGEGSDMAIATALEEKMKAGELKPVLELDTMDIAVIGYSKAEWCGLLNAQIAALLLERGVPRKVLEVRDRQYKAAVTYMTADVWAALDYLHLRPHPPVLAALLAALRLPSTDLSRTDALRRVHARLQDLQAHELARWKKNRAVMSAVITGETEMADLESLGEGNRLFRMVVPLQDARRLYGVADRWGMLRAGEVLVRITQPNGGAATVSGGVVVTRNPCYHPSDVVALTAVVVPELKFLRDVIVFSIEGDRPAADRCSGGDLDGDMFFVVWDKEIVKGVREDVHGFDYRPPKIKKVLDNTAVKMRMGTGNMKFTHTPPPTKSNIINALTTLNPPDALISKIDATIVALRQFQFPTTPDPDNPFAHERWTRTSLLDALNALFSSTVDESATTHLAALADGLHRRIVSLRTPSSSDLDMLLQECLRGADAAVEFQEHLKSHPGSVFGFFGMSADEDRRWADERYMEIYVPPKERENIDLAVRVLRLAEREGLAGTSDVKARGSVVDAETRSVLVRFLSKELVARFDRIAEEAEGMQAELLKKLEEYSAPLANLREKYRKVESGLKDAREIYKLASIDLDYNHMEKVEKLVKLYEDRKLQVTMEIVDRMDEVERIRGQREDWDKGLGRVEALRWVIKGVRKVLEGRIRAMDSKVVKDTEKILSQELTMFQSGLPIYDSRTKLVQFMLTRPVGLVLSATGSGKSTCIPHFLANELFFLNKLSPSKQIIVAQPRRQATLSLAERLAESRQSLLGKEVGSHIGKSKAKVTKYQTLINCTTYGILLHYARRDPLFSGYSVIVLDEVHEDSAELYFLFGIIKKALKTNKELKLLLMSAKVDSKKLVDFFQDCEVSGRSHPIKEIFSEDRLTTDEGILTDRVFSLIAKIHKTTELDANPDILVFLPTSHFIEACAAGLPAYLEKELGKAAAKNVYSFPLHSDVADEVKRFVLKRGPVDLWERLRKGQEEDEDEEGDVLDEADEGGDGEDDEDENPSSGLEVITEGVEKMVLSHRSSSETLGAAESEQATLGEKDKEDEVGFDIVELPSWVGDIGSWADDVPKPQSNSQLEPQPEVQPEAAKFKPLTKAERNLLIKKHKEEKLKEKQNQAAKEKRKENASARRVEALKRVVESLKQCNTDDGTRRVIFCTNIAETSLTIPKIGYVIDSGLQFTVTHRPTLNMKSSGLKPTTQVSAVQRKGRAGRVGPGTCYRMYTATDSQEFAEQTFSEPEQLDFMILSILDMYQKLDDFDWFAPPQAQDREWTLDVLKSCAFLELLEPHPYLGADRLSITDDGRIAMELGRLQVPTQTARFLIDVWRSKGAAHAPRLRQHCAVVAAMHATRMARAFRRKFSYLDLVEPDESSPFYKGGDEEEEEIECPVETLNSLPATICKVNIYWMWRHRSNTRQRAKFCKKYGIRPGDMEELHMYYNDILKFLKGRKDLNATKEWVLNGELWDENAWKLGGLNSDILFQSDSEPDEDFYQAPEDSEGDDYHDADLIDLDTVLPAHGGKVAESSSSIAKSPNHLIAGADAEDDDDDYNDLGQHTDLDPEYQIAFIVEHLVQAFSSNIAFIYNRRVVQQKNKLDPDVIYDCMFSMNGEIIHGRVDRCEMNMWGHYDAFEASAVLFSAVTCSGGHYFISHLDRFPVQLIPKEHVIMKLIKSL